jgi:tetratricopeptide (TPR) repeat protein
MSQYSNPDLPDERDWQPRNSPPIHTWPLRPGWRAGLFLLPILGGCFWLAQKGILIARVTYESDSLSLTDLQSALQQDPGNPDLLHRIGWVYAYNPTSIDLTEAVKYLRQAVELSPRRWDFWTDLGTICDDVGDTACSDEAFERAGSLNPMTPGLIWAIGNHYLLTNRPEKAFPHFRRLIELDPEYLGNTLQLCMRATQDPLAIYRKVLPHGKDAHSRFAFLMQLASSADYQGAMGVWEQMISGPDHSPSLPAVKPFLDFLLDHDRIDDAGKVWDSLQHAGAIPPAAAPSDNLLYDGSFEGPPLNTGFDWRTDDSPNLVFDFTDASAYQGSRSLRIEFAVGADSDYDLVSQVVRIKPNTSYQLSAYVRSDNLTSDSGPRLRVVEVSCAECPPRTSDPTVGTTSWHAVDVEFLTHPQTEAVRISFWRPQNQPYSSDITGTVWLNDVILRRTEGSALDSSRARTR